MNVAGTAYRTIRPAPDGAIEIIDQTLLPGSFELRRLCSLDEVAEAISSMRVRGAPLIGVTAAFGLALALRDDPSDTGLDRARARLIATRPTAVNLTWALNAVMAVLLRLSEASEHNPTHGLRKGALAPPFATAST